MKPGARNSILVSCVSGQGQTTQAALDYVPRQVSRELGWKRSSWELIMFSNLGFRCFRPPPNPLGYSVNISPLRRFFFFKIFFFYYKVRYTERRRDREEDLPSNDSIPQVHGRDSARTSVPIWDLGLMQWFKACLVS